MKEEKTCQACGRPMTYRKKWANDWAQVRYCSKACRGRGEPVQLMLDIEQLLAQRASDKSLCPSEILQGEDKKNRKKMERVRDAARLLACQGKIEITQKGQPVDPSSFKGPVRLRKKKK